MLKKFLAVLVAVGVVLFEQSAVSEAHAIAADKSAFKFTAENFSLYSSDNFDYMATIARFKCRRCGQIITFDGNPNYSTSGVAYGCPGTGGEFAEYYSDYGDRHYWSLLSLQWK